MKLAWTGGRPRKARARCRYSVKQKRKNFCACIESDFREGTCCGTRVLADAARCSDVKPTTPSAVAAVKGSGGCHDAGRPFCGAGRVVSALEQILAPVIQLLPDPACYPLRPHRKPHSRPHRSRLSPSRDPPGAPLPLPVSSRPILCLHRFSKGNAGWDPRTRLRATSQINCYCY